MQALIETYRGMVYPRECDHMGHLNVQYYTSKFDQATWQFFHTIGISQAYLRSHDKGMVAVEQRMLYKREAFPGDLLVIRSKLKSLTDKKVVFSHYMENISTGELAAECELTSLHIDSIKRKAITFEEILFQNLQSFLDTN